MARIRSAKPEFYGDAKMGTLPREARFTFKGLIEAVADDWGCFLADSRIIKGIVWPFDNDLTPKKVELYLRQLERLGVIGLYDVGGVRYGYITKWFAHQRIDHPRPPQHPEPPEQFARIAREAFESLSEKDRERLGKLSRLSGSGMWSGSGSGSGIGIGNGSGDGKGAGSGADGDEPRETREPHPPAAAPSVDRTDDNPENSADPLPPDALEVLAHLPAAKRADGERQLRAALTDPDGAKVRRGEFAKAQNVRHLAHACRHVLRGLRQRPPKPSNASLSVLWVLNKLREPWVDTDRNGRTVTEAAAENGKHERAADERDRRQRLADAEEWAAAHPGEWGEIEARVALEFDGHERDPIKASALRMALGSAKIAAAEAATAVADAGGGP